MNKILKFLGLVLFIGQSQAWSAEALRAEIPDPSSVKAFQNFWKTFEDYDNQHHALDEGKHLGSWEQIKNEWSYQDSKQRDQQIDLLEEASKRYQDHLEEHANASNTPYVKLNLAQIISKIGNLKEERSPGSGLKHKRDALAILADLSKEHPGFALMEETQYLRASLLEGLDQKETAQPIWKSLAAQARTTLFGVHAHMAVGDYLFTKERPKEALKAYQKGQELLQRLKVEDQDFELLRLQYRIAWAAYRAAELETCVAMSLELLEPGRAFRQLSVKRRVELDAVELLGDSLFEIDSMKESKAVLQRTMIRPFAGAIGYRMMTRLISMPTKTRLLDIGQFLVERFPQAREMPDILTLLADAYKSERRDEDHLATLERLSLMLPPSSLWRTQQQADPGAIRNMQEKALAATQLLASTYYEQGMAQDAPPAFRSATTYYDVLLQYDPQNPNAENWQVRRAHCFYFAGQWPQADEAYEQLKARQLSAQNLEIAYYQQALAREKLWRESLQKNLSARGDARRDPLVVERLRRLEQTIDAFADRFPNRPHTNDLLLLAASANRDLNDFSQAERYWNRALLSEPNTAQRTLAIRGLVQAKIRGGNPHEVYTLTSNFLKLENWRELGDNFRMELHGVIATAARDASEDFNKNGKVKEAGEVLLTAANEFPAIPDHDDIYRDGAYLGAIGGNWKDSLQASEQYLATRGAKSKEADMLYLKARSLEYQMNFADAAKAHLILAQRYPQFAKAKASVKRAEDLALAEEDFATAGLAAVASVTYGKTNTAKQESLVRSAGYFTKNKQWEQAQSSLQKAQKLATNAGSQLEIKMILAKLHAEKGEEAEALQLYKQIVSETARKQENLDAETYRNLAGEAHFLLAEQARREYEAYELTDGTGDFAQRVQAKSSRLERSLDHYNLAIKTQAPEWSSRARYGAGMIAENMSQTVKTALAKKDGSMEGNDVNRLREQSQRWQGLAQEYYSQNLLARHREPYRYKDSVWMERSAMKVTGYKAKDQPQNRDAEVPTSLGPSQPYQWSH